MITPRKYSSRSGGASHPFLNTDYCKFVPNYQRAWDVETHDVAAIDAPIFQRQFVDRNRPCVILGAASHWPAVAKWRDPRYLQAACPDELVSVFDTPRPEGDPIGISEQKKAEMARFDMLPTVKMKFSDFVARADAKTDTGRSGLCFLYSLNMRPDGPFGRLAADTGTYPFLTHLKRSARNIYVANAGFFYRSSVTDWHYHITAEALQTQILGVKEVILLPPSGLVWSYLRKIQRTHLHTFCADLRSFAQALAVIPYRAVLNPGDALYIPNYWWHFVSTRDNQSLGATVTTWWDSPLHVQMNLSYPAVRAGLLGLFQGSRPLPQALAWMAISVVGIVWSAAYRATHCRLRESV